jgi:AcrR family transcriptional regulator
MGRRPKVTREDVLQAARTAFAERGFEGTTLAAIAARLDLSPAALLRHAATKEELFAAAMAAGQGEIRIPFDFLAQATGEEDPRVLLRRAGEVFIPFIELKLGETVASWMRAKSGEARGFPPLPFDVNARPTPPQRALALLEEYFRRAHEAGRLALPDTQAAALAFLGSLHSYVMLHKVAKVMDPPFPLERYLDTLIEVWTRGGRPDVAGGPEEGRPAGGAQTRPSGSDSCAPSSPGPPQARRRRPARRTS